VEETARRSADQNRRRAEEIAVDLCEGDSSRWGRERESLRFFLGDFGLGELFPPFWARATGLAGEGALLLGSLSRWRLYIGSFPEGAIRAPPGDRVFHTEVTYSGIVHVCSETDGPDLRVAAC
jgi:hypothetical protein